MAKMYKRTARTQKTKPFADKPGIVGVLTLIIGALTLVVTCFAAWQSTRLDKIEAQIAEAKARSEVIHRLFIIDEIQSCSVENGFLVQTNLIWQEFQKNICEQGERNVRIAGLVLEAGGNGGLFAPKINFHYARKPLDAKNAKPILVSDLGKPVSNTQVAPLSFLQEGMSFPIFIPLVVLDNDGFIVSSAVVWPLFLDWQSPITGEKITVKLNWFAPQDEWLSNDAGIVAQ